MRATTGGLAPLLLGIVVAACVPLATKGTMPPPGPNGQVDPSGVPDFVAVTRPDGAPGYVARQAVLDGEGNRVWPVYADDLVTVVGHMVPGRGFVPAEIDPATVPTLMVSVAGAPPSATASNAFVRTYVRNAGSIDSWVAVVSRGTIQPGGAGFPPGGYIGVACLQVPVGSQLVLLDRSPVENGAVAKQTLYVGTTTNEPVSRWIDVGANGSLSLGPGVPTWWTGDTPC